MSKIREIIEKYHINRGVCRVIYDDQFDKLEKELEEYMDRDVLRQIVNLTYDKELKVVIKRYEEDN